MKSVILSESRIQRLAMELYFSGKRDFSENLEALELEIERLKYLRELDAVTKK